MASEPKTLQEAILYFKDPDNCISYLVARRWPDGVVVCPTCLRTDVTFVPARRVWQCKTRHPKAQFSIKVGTIFEDSAISLDKWLMAMWMIANCKNGISSYEIARDLGITQKSAWFVLHRIRLAMKPFDDGTKLGGPTGGAVEVDEAFVGGKLGNMHKGRADAIRRLRGTGEYEGPHDNKTAVLGMLDRESREVRAKVVPNVKRETLQNEILKNVKYGSAVYTDEAVAYDLLRRRYIHETVNHVESYVNGQVHTNCLENFWSLMKRNLAGTYVAVEPFHLDRYLDEQVFRFNNRKYKSDAERFSKVVAQIVGKRITYKELTGKTGDARPF